MHTEIMAKNQTLVIGASENPERVSYQAVMALQRHKYAVRALGIRKGQIGDIEIETIRPETTKFHTVSLYINAALQKEYYDYILSIKPERIIFNPGTENDEFAALANHRGIKTIEACTLVLLSLGTYMMEE